MNLTKLFQTQAELDKKIIEEKGLQGQDLLDKKILALQVELGELANEWRRFKFWKKDPQPRKHQYYVRDDFDNWIEVDDHPFKEDWGVGPDEQETKGVFWDENFPLLEEYVDCMHFILSIGNDLNFKEYSTIKNFPTPKEHEHIYLMTFEAASNLYYSLHSFKRYERQIELRYRALFECLIALGLMMGFTWEQIEQAYYKKNEINIQRQANGY